MSQIKKGVLISYANISLNIIVGLMLTPFIIRTLGDSEYGLYTLIGSFVAYLSFMDLGLNNTVVRFVSKYRAEKNIIGEQKFLGTTMLIYFAISAILVLIGMVLFFNLDRIFSQSLTRGQLDDAKVMFLILVFNIAITLPGNTFSAICNAYEHFVFPSSVSIVRYILRTMTVIAILKLGGKGISLVVIDTVFNIAVIFITLYYTNSRLKVRFNFKERDNKIIKQIFSYSIWIFILGITSQFQWNIGQVILGIKVNTIEVAIYAVGLMLGSYYGVFSSAISGLFLPKASQMVLDNSNEELTDMMIKIGRVSLIPLMLVLTGFILFGREFIQLWVGDQYKNSYLIAILIMIAYTIPLLQTFANSIIMAKNKVAYKAKIYLITLGVGIILGYLLMSKYGGVGMITGIVIGWIVAQIILNLFFSINIKLDILRFFKETSQTFIIPVGLAIIIGIIILNIPGQGWIYFMVKCSLYALSYCILVWIFGLNKYERQLFFRKIN